MYSTESQTTQSTADPVDHSIAQEAINNSDYLEKVKAVKILRENDINSEIYPDIASSNKQQKKQWKYATTREIHFVVTNIKDNKLTIKNMQTGEQSFLSIHQLIDLIK